MQDPLIRGYRGEVRDVKALVALVKALGVPVQLVRADRVHGMDHLRLAARLAARALAAGRARASDLPTETALYAAGERQIGKALAFLGLHEGSRAVAAVAWGEGGAAALDALAAAEGWTRDDDALSGGDAVLDAFGVTDAERAMLPRERRDELILERVALVDVLKT